MHKYYRLPINVQWLLAILLVVVGGLPLAAYAAYCASHLWALFFLPLAFSWGQFCFAPILKLTGAYEYLSPMMILYRRGPRELELQHGTSFDYLFLMRRKEAGMAARRKILLYYVQGLLPLIDEIEAERLPMNVRISGTTVFMSKKTASRLGFKLQPAPLMQYLHLFFNPVDAVLMYSYSQGRLALPPFWRMRTAVTRGSTLLAGKQRLLDLAASLNAGTAAESMKPISATGILSIEG